MVNETTNGVDLITGDPKKAIVKLAVPMVLSFILIMAYNIVDSIWVAGLGTDALAALGFISPVYMILIGIGTGMGVGATSLIARSIGADDKKTANNAGLHSILLMVILSIIIPILAVIFIDPLLVALGAQKVLSIAKEYGLIVFICSFTVFFSMMGSAILRGEGDVKRATIIMALTSVLNMILDPIFIYVFGWGMAGAAIATVLSSLVSAVIIFYWILVKKDLYLDLNLNEFIYDSKIVKDIISVSIPSSLEEIIIQIVAMVINLMLTIIAGTTAVAVFTVGWRIVSLGMVPALGLAMSALTVGGVAYGAKNFENLKITLNYSIKIGLLMSIIITALMYVLSPQIAYIFAYSGDPVLLLQLESFIRVICLFLLPIPVGAIAAYLFQGVGKGTISLVLTVLRELIFVLVFSYILGFVLNFGEQGVWWGLIVGVTIGSVMSYFAFKLFIRHSENNLDGI
ncbi:MAG: MATE family efflux transporter [Methanobacteriaceae archaeon]|nr:MATE family efflux transporter [Methanobacteriaceae archaeon]